MITLNKYFKRFCLGIFAIFFGSLLLQVPVFAAEKECTCSGSGLKGTMPETTILSESTACDCGNGESIKGLLKLVVDIMTIGIGILGVIGITIVGLQYLTSGGNEEKNRKAKRRMLEIVIGLVAYVILYSVLSFVLPTFQGLNL